MPMVDRVVASHGLGVVLALAGCSDGGVDPAEGWSSSTDGGVDTSDEGDPGGEIGDVDDESTDEGGSSTGDEPPSQGDWCLYEVLANAEQTPLNVYAAPDPTAAVQYTLDAGETVWGGPMVVDGYRDLNRSFDMPQWAETARLSNTGECEEVEPPEEVPLPQGFQLPFVCGQLWRLDSWGHAPALDMVREPDQFGTEGATLVAPAAGVVNMSFYHDNAGNVVQIDHGEGYFTTYLHMQSRSVEVGAVLVRGDEIGAVGKTGPTSNDHPHLHFELGIDADGDGEASWGFEGAERVNPWFGGVEYGQSNGLTWRDVESLNCP